MQNAIEIFQMQVAPLCHFKMLRLLKKQHNESLNSKSIIFYFIKNRKQDSYPEIIFQILNT